MLSFAGSLVNHILSNNLALTAELLAITWVHFTKNVQQYGTAFHIAEQPASLLRETLEFGQ